NEGRSQRVKQKKKNKRMQLDSEKSPAEHLFLKILNRLDKLEA
ncbi:28506_t:CDS:1, partial [Racocetra persica]